MISVTFADLIGVILTAAIIVMNSKTGDKLDKIIENTAPTGEKNGELGRDKQVGEPGATL